MDDDAIRGDREQRLYVGVDRDCFVSIVSGSHQIPRRVVVSLARQGRFRPTIAVSANSRNSAIRLLTG